MTQKQYRTIDSFISHKRLKGWKPAKPDRRLSWKEIEALYWTLLILVQDNRGKPVDPDSEYHRLEEQIMVGCLSWTKHGEKPLAVRIHDGFEDQIGGLLGKPFALRQELWYRAIAWEFNNWRFYVSRQYFGGKQKALWEEEDKLNKQIDEAIDEELEAKEKRIEAIKLRAISKRVDDMMKERERIQRRDFGLDKREDTWLDAYYKQKPLLYRWLQWRGFRLSARDIEFRLCRFVYLGTY